MVQTGEINLQSCFDWFLKGDREVVDMLSYEQELPPQQRQTPPCI